MVGRFVTTYGIHVYRTYSTEETARSVMIKISLVFTQRTVLMAKYTVKLEAFQKW
jgi:hypothetical protein